MSKTRKIFSRIILFTFLSFVFISCKNLFNSGNDEVIIHKRKAKISVSADFGKTRTVLPTSFNGTEQGYTWNLLGKKSTEEESKNLATWKDEDNKTSYQLLNETKDILIDEGTWNFELTVTKLDTTGNTVYVLYSKIENVTIKSGVENSLHFSMEEATSSNLGETAPLANGVINFTLNFPSGIVNDVQVSLYDINVLEKPVFDQTWPDYLNYGKIQFIQGEYAPGYYLLKIQLKQNIIDDQQVTINTYACIIRVSPGLTSNGEYTLESLAQMFNLNYELNFEEGESLGDVATTVTYNKYTSFELPTPTKEGYDFVGWYTDAELTNSVVLDENGKYKITQDTTLYPKWLKSYTFVLGDQDDTPSEVDTTLANYVPETKTIEVENPDNSDTVWSYYIKTQEEPNKPFFLEGKNYKISLEMKSNSNSDTVVGIQAGNTDMFFTVGENWTECSFETGFIKKALSAGKNGITIGTGLSSSVSYRNLVIEEISSDDGLPTLVFDISRNAIETYLGKTDKATKIIDVSKLEGNAGYNITINAPLSYKEATGATLQDVKLHLRSYGTETGANRVSFRVDNLGNNSFYTSVMTDTASEKSTAWNNGTNQIDPGKFGSYEIDFPNYVANDELIVDVITKSETSITEPIKLQISEFAVTKDFPDNTTPFANKIFAIQIDGIWTKIEDGAPISKEVTINKDGNIKFDVGLFNGFNDEDGSPSDWVDVTRFLYTGENLPEGLTYTKEEGSEPKFIITNGSDKDKKVKISLNENYEVVIEEVSNIVTTWDELNYRISNTSISEIVITNDLTATSTITVNKPVKIISDKNVRITRGNSIDGANFEDAFFKVESAGNLELAGTENITITLDGGNVSSTNDGGAVHVSGGTFTMNDGVTISNCNAKDGGAVYITNVGTFNITGGTITGCSATLSGGGVWMNDGSSFTMSGDSKIEDCNSSSEGGGVYVTDVNNPCTFEMLDNATITGCEAVNGGGGVSYGCGTSGTFEISENAEISNNKNNNNSYGGGGIYLYGKLTMNDGTISGNEASNGAGVYVRDNSSSFTMNGGTISDNKATGYGGGVYLSDSTSFFTMNGGVIGKEIEEGTEGAKQSWEYAATDSDFSNYAYAGGGGIYAVDGTVTIKDAKVSFNYTRNLGNDCLGKTPENTAAGGGISIVSGSLSLINSEVSYNSGYQGGGIRCYNDNTSNAGTLTLNKTLIKGNTSNPYNGSSFGGGLMVKNFNVTFEETTESTIEQNYSGDGGALFLENTTSTLKNITIQNNSYNSNGYHYGSEVLLWANANVLIDDSNVSIASTEGETRGIFINNNTNTLKLSGGAKLDAPVYLRSGTTVTVAGYLTSNATPVATITPEKYEESTPVITAADSSIYLADLVGKFALTPSADGTDYEIDESGNIVASNQSSVIYLTQAYLDENVETNTSDDSYYELEPGEYCVSANLILKYPIQINASGSEVKLYADADYTISCAEDFDKSANSAMIALPMSAGTLTLGGGEGTLTIDGSGISSLMYLILSQSTLILKDNCTITNGNVMYTAIYVSAGTFTMTGGTITNIHSSEGYGAGIHVLGSSTVVTVSGGSVCNNYNNETNSGASIYSTNNSITVLGETIPGKTLYTYNIVNGQEEDVPSGGSGTVIGITYAGTDSTSSLPKFLISSPEGLSTFRDMVNGLVLSDITIPSDESLPNQQNYSVPKETPLTEIVGQLTSDIDLELYENWTPIGTNDNPFAGSFYGKNYTVSNLNIKNATTDNQGLFGVIQGESSNKFCTITSLVVEGNITSSECNVGGIAGKATYTKFDSCVNKASVESTSSDTNVCVAGIVGYISNVEIENCYNSGNITANGAVAGIVGFESGSTISYPTFEYCINTGIITGGSYYGGIIGYAGKALSVGYCANYGKIIATSNSDTGCLIGGCSSSNTTQVTECLVVGEIETSGKYYAVSCNASVTYSIYDSTVLSNVTKNPSGSETGMATEELKAGTELEQFFSGYWYYSEGSYPIPDLEGCVSDEIWEEIKQEISSL